jgi:hypothetical protein
MFGNRLGAECSEAAKAFLREAFQRFFSDYYLKSKLGIPEFT